MNIILEWQSKHERRKRGAGEEKDKTEEREKHQTKETRKAEEKESIFTYFSNWINLVAKQRRKIAAIAPWWLKKNVPEIGIEFDSNFRSSSTLLLSKTQLFSVYSL